MADNKSSEGMVTYKCIECFAEMSVSKRREMRMDGRKCFLCNGPIHKVQSNVSVGTLTVDIDVSDALKGLKAVQREAKKATAALKEFETMNVKFPGTIRKTTLKADNEVVEEQIDYSLLTIDLETLDSVPRVFYKGEEVTNKIHVGFDWSTQTDRTVPSPMIDIEYADTSSKRPSIKRITHNPFGGDQSW